MKAGELREILNNAIEYYSQFKPNDIIKLYVEKQYRDHYWDAPYLTYDNGAFAYCGVTLPSIKAKMRSRNQTNKIIPWEKYASRKDTEEDVYNVESVKEIVKILKTALTKMHSIDDDLTIETVINDDAIRGKPYICVYEPVMRTGLRSGDFLFIELYNVKVDDIDVDKRIIQSLDDEDIYDDDEREAEYDRRWEMFKQTNSLRFLQRESKQSISYSQLKKHLNESNNYFRRAVNFWTGYNLDYSQRRTAELIGDCLKNCMEDDGGDFEDKLYLYDSAISRLIHAIFSNDVREKNEIAKDIERIVGRCIEDESLAFECTDNILSILEQSYW